MMELKKMNCTTAYYESEKYPTIQTQDFIINFMAIYENKIERKQKKL